MLTPLSSRTERSIISVLRFNLDISNFDSSILGKWFSCNFCGGRLKSSTKNGWPWDISSKRRDRFFT